MERSDFFKQIAQRLAWVAAKRDPRRLRLELLKKIDRICGQSPKTIEPPAR